MTTLFDLVSETGQTVDETERWTLETELRRLGITPDAEEAARLLMRALGGRGSGNFGHAGRPGQVGGSSIMFHGTQSSALESIKARGLVPAAGVGGDAWLDDWTGGASKKYEVGDRKASVYLAKNWRTADQFSRYAADKNPGSKAVVLRVRVPNNIALVKDELGEKIGGQRFKGTILPEWIEGIVETGRGKARALESVDQTFYVVVVTDEEPVELLEKRALAVGKGLLHAAADSFVSKFSVAFRYAFARGQRAIKPLLAALRIAGGAGSGHHGHSGRPGQVGGSSIAHFVKATAEQRKEMKIPPAWTDVRVNPDPNGDVRAVGRDAKGRDQRLYSAEHSKTAAAEKFARLQEFNQALPGLRADIEKDLESDDSEVAETATLLRLVDRTSFRIGSNRETLADKKAYGASTLEARHVKIDGEQLAFNFVGKKGVRIKKTVEDGKLATAMKPRVTEGPIFNQGADARARDYIKQHAPGFTPKDFRTYHGTSEALKAMKKLPTPKTAAEKKRARREVGKIVAKVLGNTPAVSLSSYINPAVFGRWEQ